jgi:uncharacterized protein (DUF488 family)
MTEKTPQIWTVGHSTLSIDDFIAELQSQCIELLADVRRFPASRRYPHFERHALQASLAQAGIGYQWFPALGGRRPAHADSHNTAWRNESFRGYADYMETPAFAEAIAELKAVAQSSRTALMCAEAVWWRCHRGLIADYLKAQGYSVTHILSVTKTEPHPYTSAASLVDGRLSYEAPAAQTSLPL